MERKDYWNQTYVDYYKERVEESNTAKQDASKLIAEDVKVADDHVAEVFFNQVTYTPGMKLLDIGYGWGRFSSFFREKGVDYYGGDISEQMISSALEDYPDLTEKLFVAEVENLPFSGGGRKISCEKRIEWDFCGRYGVLRCGRHYSFDACIHSVSGAKD